MIVILFYTRGTARLRPGDEVLPVNNFLCKFPVLKNYKGNFTTVLTKTFLGEIHRSSRIYCISRGYLTFPQKPKKMLGMDPTTGTELCPMHRLPAACPLISRRSTGTVVNLS